MWSLKREHVYTGFFQVYLSGDPVMCGYDGRFCFRFSSTGTKHRSSEWLQRGCGHSFVKIVRRTASWKPHGTAHFRQFLPAGWQHPMAGKTSQVRDLGFWWLKLAVSCYIHVDVLITDQRFILTSLKRYFCHFILWFRLIIRGNITAICLLLQHGLYIIWQVENGKKCNVLTSAYAHCTLATSLIAGLILSVAKHQWRKNVTQLNLSLTHSWKMWT